MRLLAALLLQHAFRLVVALRRRFAQPANAFFVVARHTRTFEVRLADLRLGPSFAELGAGEVILESGVALPELLLRPAAVREREARARVDVDDERRHGNRLFVVAQLRRGRHRAVHAIRVVARLGEAALRLRVGIALPAKLRKHPRALAAYPGGRRIEAQRLVVEAKGCAIVLGTLLAVGSI